jgi:hypothetical protein
MNTPKQNENRIKALGDDQLEHVVGGWCSGDFNQDGAVNQPSRPTGFSSVGPVIGDR